MEKTKDIEQGNKLIASFMGLRTDSFPNGLSDSWYVDVENPTSIYHNNSPKESKFHSSWDWLMPVVEKIEDLGYAVIFRKTDEMRYINIYGGHIGEDFKNLYDAPNKQYAVFMTVVEFIQWFNTNSKEGSKL